jgi:hypothetical protein
MPRVTGRDHRSLAGAGNQRPAVVRLQAVVVNTQRVEVRELRDLIVGPRHTMVDLDADGAGTSLDLATRRAPQYGDALGRPGPSADVGDVGDVDAPGDHQLDDGLPEQLTGGPGGDRADARDFAQLVARHPSSDEGLEIDAQEGEVSRIGSLCPAPTAGVGRRAGQRARARFNPSGWRGGTVIAPAEMAVRQLDERVECVRLAGFATSPTPRGGEELVDDRVRTAASWSRTSSTRTDPNMCASIC